MTELSAGVLLAVEAGFGAPHAVVVGDVMLDRYLLGDVGRISPEAPVPVVQLRDAMSRVGGAGNVALNLTGLGARVTVAGWVGSDDSGRDVIASLQQNGADTRGIVPVRARPTTTKTRVLSQHQQLVRIDDEEVGPLDADDRAAFDERVVALLDDSCDVVVLSDYAKGVLAPELCRALIDQARARSIPVIVDPKGVDFSKYAGATAITPNEAELRHACRLGTTDLRTLIDATAALRLELGVDALIVTRGEHGILLVTDDGAIEAPARAREVFDVSGAGDTVVATIAAGRAGALEWPDAVRVANVAAGLTVAKTGTVPVTRDELLDALRTQVRPIAPPASKIHALDDLARVAAEWRSTGQVIGFTNGCFDVLHAGHVASLDWARRHCDRLVVAVNSDDSVRQLKGPERPLMAEGDRATVLAALEAVDAVVVFADDTPLQVINAVRPDILVKGSDYREDDIVGATEVRSWGGRVLLGPMLDGRSSTGLIERARGLG